MAHDRLNRSQREESLERMSREKVDVLVVGGGVTGAGIALDAAGRGLDVALVEAQDWGAGTSSRSSKLVHGGLRYLQMLDFKLVAEALVERGLLLDRLAPHLVRAVPFLYPLEHQWERPYVAAGVGLYDILATVGTENRAVPTHRHLGRPGMAKAFPGIRSDVAVGAIKYYDGQVDDARLVLGLVRTAVSYGAAAASHTEVLELTKDVSGRVDGARVRDAISGEEFHIRAGTVVAAAGVWTERTQQLAGTDGGLKVLASKGIHIVVPRDRIDGTTGIILQTKTSVLFIIPWSRYWVIGTTDTAYHEDLVHPVATVEDIDYVIGQANRILRDPLTPDDVIGTWAGLRPLLQPKTEGGGSSKVSREHTVMESTPGLVSIAGGKLTTYRVMAKDAVDFVLGDEEAKKRPSLSHKTPLIGAVGFAAFATRADGIGEKYGWDRFRMAHLLHRYGSSLPELLELVDARPELARPLPGADAYIGAEIVYGITHEGALHLSDLMVTRTRLTYEVRGHALDAIDEIAALAAAELGWDETTTRSEIGAYRDRCEAEDAAARRHDDASASAVRGRAGDLVDVLLTDSNAPQESATETDPRTPGEAKR
ncbi:glycerol-3-phosphate dehydrogenase/oxidase [Mobilicoccus massiliensis]|uniref:glycerol-3-phosphate dehydrogenase/oxidase n=1 Tax=Mobilicoccus massiliensis TaxID=1522310 RepID=UPI000693EEDE|nr:glycerol-3-phosphate dehydrogenase/oxidase [Mobilicoccus massiliensis]